MKAPRCSFVVPVRDAETTLGAAIESCLAQTIETIEVIVVDDGSADRSLEVARAWAARDARVRCLFGRRPAGIAAALRRGVSAAGARWVARMDADDVAEPQRLAQQLPILEADERLAVVDGQVRFVRDHGTVPQGMRLYGEWINRILEPADFRRTLLVESPVVHPAATLRKQAVIDVGGYRSGDFPEDYDLWLRLDRAGWRFRKVPAPVVTMRDHDRRSTRVDPAYRKSAFRALAQAWIAAELLPSCQRIVLWGAGRGGRAWSRWLEQHGRSPVAVIDIDARKIGRRRRGAPIVAPAALPAIDADLCLVAVASRGARDEIGAALRGLRPDWAEGRDWWHVVC